MIKLLRQLRTKSVKPNNLYCAICYQEVDFLWKDEDENFGYWFPESLYWKGTPKEVEEVFCAPTCSLKYYESRRNNTI